MRQLATVRSYDDLHQALRDRADEIDVSRNNLDEVTGLPNGYVGKLLGGKQVKNIGAMSLGLLLSALRAQADRGRGRGCARSREANAAEATPAATSPWPRPRSSRPAT
jgi:hypothetical protein